jgi:hypothetical protein
MTKPVSGQKGSKTSKRKAPVTRAMLANRSRAKKPTLLVRDVKETFWPIQPLHIVKEDPTTVACKFSGIFNVNRADLFMDGTCLGTASRDLTSVDIGKFVKRSLTSKNKPVSWHCIFCKIGFSAKQTAVRHADGSFADNTNFRPECDMRKGRRLKSNLSPALPCDGVKECLICSGNHDEFVKILADAFEEGLDIGASTGGVRAVDSAFVDEGRDVADKASLYDQASGGTAASETDLPQQDPTDGDLDRSYAMMGDGLGITDEIAVYEQTLQFSAVISATRGTTETTRSVINELEISNPATSENPANGEMDAMPDDGKRDDGLEFTEEGAVYKQTSPIVTASISTGSTAIIPETAGSDAHDSGNRILNAMHGASGSSSHQIQAEEQLVSTNPGFLELPNMTKAYDSRLIKQPKSFV